MARPIDVDNSSHIEGKEISQICFTITENNKPRPEIKLENREKYHPFRYAFFAGDWLLRVLR